jgi:hypothetical protein
VNLTIFQDSNHVTGFTNKTPWRYFAMAGICSPKEVENTVFYRYYTLLQISLIDIV